MFASLCLINIFTLISLTFCQQDLVVLSRTQTSFLEKYEDYKDVVMIHLKIPQDTLFASFKFSADETEIRSIISFGCKPRNVTLYLKHGAPPVINPDSSPFPDTFKNITREEMYHVEFLSDKNDVWINITSPEPGFYYAATFLSYTNPKFNKITQEGLSPNCFANVEAFLYAKKLVNPLIISENERIEINEKSNLSRYFKFYVPTDIDHAKLTINANLAENIDKLTVRININKPPSENSYTNIRNIYNNETFGTITVWTRQECWHYVEFKFNNMTNDVESYSNASFNVRFYSDNLNYNNLTFYNNSITKAFRSEKLTDLIQYKEYNLVRESSSETFLFSYELQQELESNVAVPINVTNDHFSLLKFRVKQGTDIGGTLQFIMAFKPRIKRTNSGIKLDDEPSNHSIIACIRKGVIEVPTWPSNCVYNNIVKDAQLILNKTTDNTTILIPYPESGVWFATFKLFCGGCTPCNCPDLCQIRYEDCLNSCEENCVVHENCSECSTVCSQKIINIQGCGGCNCDGPCLKNDETKCNTSVIFDIGSHPCIFGKCSRNGRCMFMVSDGVVFSTCVCTNKYRGWDCSDDSQATPCSMVILELMLLVLSNMAFLPGVYIAFKRKFYIESIVYFSICFFSTFYHACDAGEKIISFCLVRIDALQFGDFFCALLAIWVTLIAMADLPQLSTSIAHMLGAIILAFCVTINKAALWIFALPSVTGLIVVAVRWWFKYKKVGQRFGNKRYLTVYVPIGMAIVAVGLIMYAFLQTENNYKYLHSLWHISMAVALVIVLPKPNTFHPEVLL